MRWALALSMVLLACGAPEPETKVTAAGPWMDFIGGGFSPMVMLSINGGPPRAFVIDTGAQANFVDPDLPELRDLNAVRIGDNQWNDVFFERHVQFEFQVHGETEWGVLGAPFFFDHTLAMDYRNDRFGIFESPEDARRHMDRTPLEAPQVVPAEMSFGWLLIEASVYDNPVLMMVDTAANNELDAELAEDILPNDLPALEGIPIFNPQTGRSEYRAVNVCDLEIAAETSSSTFTINPMTTSFNDGILGTQFLRHHFVAFDYANLEISLSEYAEPDPEAKEGWSPFYWQKDSEGYSIWYVYPGSDAERSGIVAGDRLLEVEGMPTGELSREAVDELLRGDPGELRHIRVGPEDSPRELQFRIEHPFADSCPTRDV